MKLFNIESVTIYGNPILTITLLVIVLLLLAAFVATGVYLYLQG